MNAQTQTVSVLGKRKGPERVDTYVLHLLSDPESVHDADSENEVTVGGSAPRPLLINGKLVDHTNKPYQCTHPGCGKAYSKPSRLEEHERSHSGTRPFECPTCHKTYLRESHLQAHSRSHLPESARPLVCSEGGCTKRFWTSQHLRAHVALHKGARPFGCTVTDCEETFAKHYQLRKHMCTVHAPPGTKPFRCQAQGCSKSFDTNQHLRAHVKTHDDKRYTCVKPSCLAVNGSETVYFPTWTALQHHMRTAHPPICTHPACGRKTFTSQKGLRAHQKLHNQRDLEARLIEAAEGSDANEEEEDGPPRKKPRRGGELGRDWKCDVEGCTKDFKSKKALTSHVNVNHLGQRNFVCDHSECGRAFGYKHLLQRHVAKVHNSSSCSSSDESTGDEMSAPTPMKAMSTAIDDMTGLSYAINAQAKVDSGQYLPCPFPDLDGIQVTGGIEEESSNASCEYVFRRSYDFRRHLHSAHGVQADKANVEAWVWKRRQVTVES